MKYEYKTIRYIPYVGRSGACTLSYEEFDDYGLFAWQILEQGRLGWKVVASGCNSDGEITTVIMERISGQNETQKGRAKLARYVALPTSGGKWAVMDTTRRHNVNVSVWDTVMDATAEAVRLNMSGEGAEQ